MSEATVKSTISVDANAVKKTPAARNDKQLPDIDFDRFKTSRSFAASRKRKDVFMKSLICLAFIIACIPLISVLWTTIANGIKRLNLNFLSYNMSGVVGGSQTPSGGYGGVLHASPQRGRVGRPLPVSISLTPHVDLLVHRVVSLQPAVGDGGQVRQSSG